MKRRVSRSHSNKKNLRVISSAHRLTNNNLKHIHVLCDSSFLRMFLQHTDHSGQKNPSKTRGAFDSLRQLSLDAFGVLHSKVITNTTDRNTRGNSKNSIFVNFFYLPQTESKLRDTVKDSTSRSIRDLLSGFQKISFESLLIPTSEDNSSPQNTVEYLKQLNEVNIISHFIRNFQNKPLHVELGHRVNTVDYSSGLFYFIATQNHDVRRSVPSTSALVRLTVKPLAMWIEYLESNYQYSKLGDTPNEPSALSPLDMAFVKHLAQNSSYDKTRTTKASSSLLKKMNITSDRNVKNNADVKPIDNQEPTAIKKTKNKNTGLSHQKAKIIKKRATKGPNPLSMKKKKSKLVFRAQ